MRNLFDETSENNLIWLESPLLLCFKIDTEQIDSTLLWVWLDCSPRHRHCQASSLLSLAHLHPPEAHGQPLLFSPHACHHSVDSIDFMVFCFHPLFTKEAYRPPAQACFYDRIAKFCSWGWVQIMSMMVNTFWNGQLHKNAIWASAHLRALVIFSEVKEYPLGSPQKNLSLSSPPRNALKLTCFQTLAVF